jgi:hypothetical protein
MITSILIRFDCGNDVRILYLEASLYLSLTLVFNIAYMLTLRLQ